MHDSMVRHLDGTYHLAGPPAGKGFGAGCTIPRADSTSQATEMIPVMAD